jgi:hypothetical protein
VLDGGELDGLALRALGDTQELLGHPVSCFFEPLPRFTFRLRGGATAAHDKRIHSH